MHCHLKECIKDYGPSHVFWLYAFERYNGILGSMPNNKSIESQLMRRFIEESNTLSVEVPSEFSDKFMPILPVSKYSGSLLMVSSASDIEHTQADEWTFINIPEFCCQQTLSKSQKKSLINLYTNSMTFLNHQYIVHPMMTFSFLQL